MKNIEDKNKVFAPNNYGFLFKHHHDAICVMNLDGYIVYSNLVASELFKYSDDELLNLHYDKLISSEEFETFNYYLGKVVEGETHEFESVVNDKKGGNVELQVIMVPNEIEGQIVNISLYMKDITEQRKVKLELELVHKDLCESFIENNRDPILLLDLNATIVLANSAFSRLLGWRKENLEGFHILRCPSIPPHLVEQMRDYYHHVVTSQSNSDLTSNSELSTLETIRVTNEEKAYHMMLSITPINDQCGKVCNWAVHLRDITVQKEAEKSLLRAEKLLAIGQIAAGVAHEIRNPLQSLKGLTQLISTSRDGVVDYDLCLNVMIGDLKQIETFVDEFALLGRTQLESYKMKDMTRLLQDVIQSLKTHTIVNDVHIEFEYDEVPSIWCEEMLLKQAFFNVIQNGIEAMETGGTLYIGIKCYGDRLEVNVIDHGVGISKERIQKLGEPFYSNKEKGFGLGLMLTYKIIDQHHGKVTIQSEVGLGTHVSISLPISSEGCPLLG
ncbi:PAS domain S-box protein [Alkalihalobacillus deserti]|uniref:PAS domain S-box protein n=1 Tax=Alkalihalobacillus deserti TaxID=2879466 RepID=UPI001D1508D5|nr:PAS domain S-box protein [Alkalihalobacillus deserti]